MIGCGDGEGPATVPPGPGLATALHAFDLREVSNDDAVDLLIAQHRQLSHEQARLWAAIDEVLHRQRFTRPGAHVRLSGLDIDGADEVRAALTWTRRAAEAEAHHAHTLVCELPLVWQALHDGLIDRGKALVFARHLPDLTPEQITRLCGHLSDASGIDPAPARGGGRARAGGLVRRTRRRRRPTPVGPVMGRTGTTRRTGVGAACPRPAHRHRRRGRSRGSAAVLNPGRRVDRPCTWPACSSAAPTRRPER